MHEIIINNDYWILLIGLLLIVGVVATKFSSKVGVPALVLFLIAGMILGSDGVGLIHFDNPSLAQSIGVLALVVIIFEGGLQTKWSLVKPVASQSAILATVGVLITSVIVGVAAKYVLNVSWLEGLLFGAIVGSTDAAAVFTVLKGRNINTKLKATLEMESGSNDPMAMFLTLSFIQLINANDPNYLLLLGSFLWQMGLAVLLGFVLSKLALKAINGINLDSGGLYPVFAVAFAFLIYSVTALLGASGLMAVYVAALVIGNSEIVYHHSIFSFNEGLAWMMQILMFIILGLFVFPSQLLDFNLLIRGLTLSFILIIVARPIAVFLSLINMGFSFKERLFLSWAGLKGAVPIVLATYPMIYGMENSNLFFNIIFFIVLTSCLIQGSTITYVAENLGLTGPKKIQPPHSLELISIGKANSEMMEVELSKDMRITGRAVMNSGLPKGVLISAIIRGNDIITPNGSTILKPKDIIYILVPKAGKKTLIRFLENKSKEG